MNPIEEKALNYLRETQELRQVTARRLLTERRDMRNTLDATQLPPRARIKIVNQLSKVACHYSGLFKPTPANLLKAAKDLLAYSKTRWHNYLDTEYYSACGYDDAQADARWQARKDAALFYCAWRLTRNS